MVGRAIAGRRDDIVLASKAYMPMGEDPNHRGSSQRWLVTELEHSLRRLGVDDVDLYQVHRWDPTTSDEETLSAAGLGRLQMIPGAGHYPHVQFPSQTVTAIRSFLDTAGVGTVKKEPARVDTAGA